jgi:small subunit ribosomal protein S17
VEPAVEETAVEAAADDGAPVEEAPAEEAAETAAPAEEGPTVEAAPAEEVEAAPVEEVEVAPAEESVVEAAPALEEKPKKAAKAAPKAKAAKKTPAPAEPVAEKVHKRAEKIGIVSSDKMMKTVTVRVDRLVKHPVYRKYVKKRKKFMAHDEMGAKIGDKVRIIETRPLSARKRWRVVEILHKAEL